MYRHNFYLKKTKKTIDKLKKRENAKRSIQETIM